MNFALLWKFFEPISFGLIGMEVNLSILSGSTVGWSVIVMIFPLLVITTSSKHYIINLLIYFFFLAPNDRILLLNLLERFQLERKYFHSGLLDTESDRASKFIQIYTNKCIDTILLLFVPQRLL